MCCIFVQPFDNTAALEYASTSALLLNGGALRDLAGNLAILTLPSLSSGESLAHQSKLVLDTLSPACVMVNSTTAVRP